MVAADDMKDCPFCAEPIRAAAVKCRYCGELLDDLDGGTECPHCGVSFRSVHHLEQHIARDHDTTAAQARATYVASPSKSKKQKLSDVADTSSGALACPKCGGTQFTAKRSTKGKVIGFSTLGVGGLLAPKSMVKCVTCGTTYKRG